MTHIQNINDFHTYIELYRDVKEVAINIKTTSGKPTTTEPLHYLILAAEGRETLAIEWNKLPTAGSFKVKTILENTPKKILHNAKQDLKLLANVGIIIKEGIFDTYLAATLLTGEDIPNLEELIKKYLSKDVTESNWNGEKTESLLLLKKKLLHLLKVSKLIPTAKVEFSVIPAIVEMEQTGMKVDRLKINELSETLERERDNHRKTLTDTFGQNFNPNSAIQIKELFKKHNISIKDTTRETLALKAQQYPIIQTLLDYKKAEKKYQFAEKLQKVVESKGHRIHSIYHQLGTATGRLSCTDFNLQQVPHDKVFRECFIPENNNCFVIADYSQMQIRIAAEISGDEQMIQAYLQGKDLHTKTAAIINHIKEADVTPEMRKAAKAVNFGMLFGMGAPSLVSYARKNYGVAMTEKEAKTFIASFFNTYKGLKLWQKQQYNKKLPETRTIGGRRRILAAGSNNYTKKINSPIQGTEADILKNVLGVLLKLLKKTTAKIIATIHDEIIIECRNEEAEQTAQILKNTMEVVGCKYLKRVPVVADVVVTENWSGK